MLLAYAMVKDEKGENRAKTTAVNKAFKDLLNILKW